MRAHPAVAALVLPALAIACSASRTAVITSTPGGWPDRLPASARVASVTGFSGPEAVRYDPAQDVYFVANFNGGSRDLDNNGFISRMRPDGTIDSLRFITGGRDGVTLHAPRGMTITGDTLWACDVDAVRAFDRRTGAPLASVDFTGRDVGFLNDIAPGPDGALYVTDTGQNRIYRISGGRVDGVTTNEQLNSPNGITWSAPDATFVVVPFGGSHDLLGYDPGSGSVRTLRSGSGARYDGVEVLPDGAIIVASQADSSLHVFRNGNGRAFVRTAGPPADIGLDVRRLRVAVPFIALNTVEIWQLPR